MFHSTKVFQGCRNQLKIADWYSEQLPHHKTYVEKPNNRMNEFLHKHSTCNYPREIERIDTFLHQYYIETVLYKN